MGLKNSPLWIGWAVPDSTRVMNITPVSKIEKYKWGASIILRVVDNGVYIITCRVHSSNHK